MAMRGGRSFVIKWKPVEEREQLKKKRLSETLLNVSKEESQHRLYEIRSKIDHIDVRIFELDVAASTAINEMQKEIKSVKKIKPIDRAEKGAIAMKVHIIEKYIEKVEESRKANEPRLRDLEAEKRKLKAREHILLDNIDYVNKGKHGVHYNQ